MFERIGGLITNDRYEALITGLPEELPGEALLCRCGLCDGYGHWYVPGQGMRLCPNYAKKITNQGIDEYLNRFAGWPASGLAELSGMENFVRTNSYQAVWELWQDIAARKKPRALILCGGPGRGKTLSSLALLSECIEAGIRCFGIKMYDWIEAYKRGLDGLERRKSILRHIRSSTVVVVDEIAPATGENDMHHAQVALENLIIECYEDQYKFLILTCNLSSRELTKKFSQPQISRLHKHAGFCKVIEEPFSDDLRIIGRLFG